MKEKGYCGGRRGCRDIRPELKLRAKRAKPVKNRLSDLKEGALTKGIAFD